MPLRIIREFIKLESSAGVILFITAILALIVDNSRAAHFYEAFFNTKISISISQFTLEKPLLLWINDGFMTIFFLLVGLEIKREIFEGELNSTAKVLLPAIAAIGGMIAPALIYTYINRADSFAMHGWAIPTATDIAFSLAILSLLNSRIPVSLKIFLTVIAIFDDIGAIIIIAIYYTSDISVKLLLAALFFVLILLLMNRFKVRNLGPYFVVGVALWLCVLKSGIHATLSGILLAFAIPLKDIESQRKSPLRLLEHKLHPWVAFGVLPLFAFANAGVSFSGVTWKHLLDPISLGIALGLLVGKQLGIFWSTMLAIQTGVVTLPKEISLGGIYGVSLVAGVGFTMSLFIGTLAFPSYYGTHAVYVRLGVIFGSIISGMLGYFLLRIIYSRSPNEPTV